MVFFVKELYCTPSQSKTVCVVCSAGIIVLFCVLTGIIYFSLTILTGRSYGGACCNALLKVLYDAESEAAEEAQQHMSPLDLFDDDDESHPLSRTFSGIRSRTSDGELILDSTIASNISWASLLRKMKAEMHEIEYPQAPKLTCSRKIDLSAPFSLIPEDFDNTKNKKRSLLVGCNYVNIEGAELKASHDDIRSMKVSFEL